MPQVRQYQTQVQPSGPVNVQRATGEDFGSEIGVQAQGLGHSLEQLGGAIHKQQALDDVSNLDAQMAQAKDRLGLQYQDQLQKGTLKHDDFMESVNDELDSLGQKVNTREGQLRFNQMQAATKLQFSQEAQHGEATLAGENAVQNVRVASDARTSFVMGNPARFQQTLQEQDQAIDDSVALHGLPATKAPELKREAMDKLAMGAVRGTMQTDPELARKQLDSGMWDPYMSENTKWRMDQETERAQRAKAQDQERLQKLQDKAASAVQEQTAQNFLSKLHDDQGPGLSSKDVLNAMQSGKIDSTTAEHFWRAIDSDNQEKKLKSDPTVFNDLTRRLALPDGAAGKITDIGPINAHLGKDISIPDANLLYGLLGEKHTPQGEADSAMQKTYFEAARTQLVKKDVMGMEDPEGMKLYQDVQAKSLQYSLDAMKNGKTKNQIWSPTINGKENPDYVGNHISTPFRSPQDKMKSTAEFLKRSMTEAPPETTEMELPDGTSAFIPNKNLDAATKRGAKKKVK